MLDNMSNTEFWLWVISIGCIIWYIGAMVAAHFDRKQRDEW